MYLSSCSTRGSCDVLHVALVQATETSVAVWVAKCLCPSAPVRKCQIKLLVWMSLPQLGLCQFAEEF